MLIGCVVFVVADLSILDYLNSYMVAPVAGSSAPAVAFKIDNAVGILPDSGVFKIGNFAVRMGFAHLNPWGRARRFA